MPPRGFDKRAGRQGQLSVGFIGELAVAVVDDDKGVGQLFTLAIISFISSAGRVRRRL